MRYLFLVLLFFLQGSIFGQSFAGVKHYNYLYLESGDSLKTSFLSSNSFSYEYRIISKKANQIFSMEAQYIPLYDTFRLPLHYLAGFPIVNDFGEFRFGAGFIPTFGENFTLLASGEMSIALNVIENRGICILGLRNSRDLRISENRDRINFSSSVFGGIMINLNSIYKRYKK